MTPTNLLCLELDINPTTLWRWQRKGKAPRAAILAAAWLVQNNIIHANDIPAVLEMGANND